ncbi:MAG: divergent polysaccharide deacetylase family protein, partial [Pseudomonadota bacterium]|nr:divergent polysaccharide deacetylase family protein [Pseudomonadota bacterium]
SGDLVIEGLETTETDTAVIIAPHVKLAFAPAKGFTEKGPDGPLPRIARDGRRPFDVYARPVHRAVLDSDQPKVAILLGGMGLNGELTGRASTELPGEVSFAFAPYGNDLQQAIGTARGKGHEVMLHLPMEPFGYPAENPGPRTLLASASESDNQASLLWHLSRFSGYTGVVNYLGARLTGEETPLTPLLRELASRGLVFLDDGSSARSRIAELGSRLALPVRQADLVLDSSSTFTGITDNLRKLEEIAKAGHIAIGVGTGLPATIDAIAAWAKGLEERGILLVPVSAGFLSRPG